MTSETPQIVTDDLIDTSSELSELRSSLFDEVETSSNTTDFSDSRPSKRRKLRATNTWQYSRKANTGEPERDPKRNRIFYCSYTSCSFTGTVTTNIRAHLKTHGILVSEQEPLAKKAGKEKLKQIVDKMKDHAASQRDKAEQETLKKCIQKRVVREALAELIVTRNLPYEATTWPELRALLLSVNYMADDALAASKNTVPATIRLSYEIDKEVLKGRLHTAISPIHLSFDCWSSPNRKSFLAIVAHFVDDTSYYRKALLALPYLPTRKRAEDQLDPLWNTLEDFGILDKLGYCVGDNEGTNDKLVRLLSQRLHDRGIAPQYDVLQHRIRCHGHIINLAVQAFFLCEDKEAVDEAFALARATLEADDAVDENDIELILAEQFKKKKNSNFTFRSMGPAGKLHNLVVSIRSSNARYNEFVGWAGRMIPMDNDTRWNSWFSMIRIALQPHVRRAIQQYFEKYFQDFEDEDFISPTDWETLKYTADFLQPFERVTKELEGDKSTLDYVLYTMDFLVKHYERSSVSEPASQ